MSTQAPDTVRHILNLVRQGGFDSVHFGSIVSGFYMQVFNNRQDRLVPGSPDLVKFLQPIKAEPTVTRHRRGALSLPPGSAADTSVPAFSIILGDASHIDDKQTLFGHVETGMDVVERLEQVPRAGGTTPSVRLTILYAEVVTTDALSSLVLEGPRSLSAVMNLEPPPLLERRAYELLQLRCFSCHGRERTESGLDLTSQASLFRGGKHGRVVYRGNGVSSPLRQRVAASDKMAMPPKGPPLTVAELALLTCWLDAGAPYPQGTGPVASIDDEDKSSVTSADAAFWAFAPLHRSAPPAVQNKAWSRTLVDPFVLSKLEAQGLAPNQDLDRRTLIRRLSFDLIGLPPTPDEIDAFVKDRSPDAVNVLVDRLLASPHYGERWAQHWLDLARYADSGGYEDDNNRPHAYAYRDFVIRALNDDLPYGTFLRWQIAGDEIEPNNPLAVAATGFVTAGPLQTFFPQKRDRYDELDDIVSTMGTAMLGLTVGCARCHDHKHDPIPMRDYYRLQAVFAGSHRVERPLPVSMAEAEQLRMAEIAYFRLESERLKVALRSKIRERRIDGLDIPADHKRLLRDKVQPENRLQAELLERWGSYLTIEGDDMFGEPDDRAAYQRVAKPLEELLAGKPAKALTVIGGLGPAYFLERGDAERERDQAPPGFLTVLTLGQPLWKANTWQQWAPCTSDQPLPQPRRALANWLIDVDHGAGRLAARVIVNRLWQHHFGEGLVRTPNDFGNQGSPPSHPELLDELAGELIANGWHLKPIHRLIVTSAAYGQDAEADPAKAKADPENRLFGRQRPRRLEAELLRDAVLTVSGSLNRKMYGPGIKPPMPSDAIFPTAPKHGEVWPIAAEDGPAVWRRSIYITRKRSNPVPFLQQFDAPESAASCACRGRTTVPTQALLLMNDPFVHKQAELFARRVEASAGTDPEQQVEQAFRLALGRSPRDKERTRAVLYLQTGSLAELCQVLFQTNEFAYID